VGDLVLKWDKYYEDKGEDIKFEKLWCGPFIISKKLGPSCWSWSLIIFLIKRYYKVTHLTVEIMLGIFALEENPILYEGFYIVASDCIVCIRERL